MGRLLYFVTIVIVACVEALMLNDVNFDAPLGLQAFVVIAVIAETIRAAVSVARARNAGKSKWIGLSVVIPLLGLIPLVYLLVVPPKQMPSPLPA